MGGRQKGQWLEGPAEWAGARFWVLVLADPRGPAVSGVQGQRGGVLRKPRGLPHTRPLHLGAAHVGVRPRIWYAPGIDPAISRVLSACPTAGPTATVWGGVGVGGSTGGAEVEVDPRRDPPLALAPPLPARGGSPKDP